MRTHRNIYLLFNWIFVLGLLLLALNDHYFKWQFSNWLTGKISDFVGLIILPMLLLFFFPKLTQIVSVISGLLFIFWKLPVSENVINIYNQITPIPIVRTVDYSDLTALTVLPCSHLLIRRIEKFKIHMLARLSLSPLFILIPCCLIFMATSPPISYYMKPNGDIHIGKSYKMKMSKEKILEKLKAQGFSVRLDTAQQNSGMAEYYLIENVVLSGGKDTIKSIQFGF